MKGIFRKKEKCEEVKNIKEKIESLQEKIEEEKKRLKKLGTKGRTQEIKEEISKSIRKITLYKKTIKEFKKLKR